MIPLVQNPPTKFYKNFLNLNYTTPLVITGFEQLSSSICCRVIAGQSFSLNGKNYAFLKPFEFCQKLGF